MWYEGSIAYHYYALAAHIDLLEAARRAGMNLYRLPVVKKMFQVPLDMLMPDGTLPPLNDSSRTPITKYCDVYEVAFERYGDPAFGRVIQQRSGETALFWGAERVPHAGPASEPVSRSGRDDGLAVLRSKDGTAALYLDYVKSVAQHTQPVRLHVLLYAQGDIRFVDPATFPYGHPMHQGWGRQSFAHNTVVVNEKNQAPSVGKLNAYASGDGWALVRADAPAAYEGAQLDRTILMRDNVIVDVFRCTADKNCTFDLPLHMRGKLRGLPPGQPVPHWSDKPGYREARDVTRLEKLLSSFSLDTGEGRRILVTVLDRSEAFVAKGYGVDMTDLLPMVVRRQKGRCADFVAVYQLLEPDRTSLEVSANIGKEVVVSVGDAILTVGADTIVTVAGLRHMASDH